MSEMWRVTVASVDLLLSVSEKNKCVRIEKQKPKTRVWVVSEREIEAIEMTCRKKKREKHGRKSEVNP